MTGPPASGTGSEGRHRWSTLLLMGFGVALVVVDITVINVIMPTIISSLDLVATDAEWVNTTYPLVFAALLIPFGRLGDRWGSKALFVAGLAVFGAASFLAGGASGAGSLVAYRALQGAGAAMILPSTLSTVHSTFSGKDRAIAFGIWGSLIAGMAAVGPLLGGWLATEWSWRWAFLINVPLAALTIAFTLRWVNDRRTSTPERGFDGPGFLAAAIGMLALVFALIEGPRHGWFVPTDELWVGSWLWPSKRISVVPFAAVVGISLLASFVRIEQRRGEAGQVVLFDLALFRFVTFRRGNLLAAIVGLGEFGLVFVLPLFARIVLGYSAFETGRLLLAMAAGGFIGGPLAAGVSRRFDPRTAVIAGMGLESLGVLGVVALLSEDTRMVQFVIPLFVYGLGVGMASAQLASVVMSEIPERLAGQASGMQSTARQLGAALGIAILGTVYFSSLGALTNGEIAGIVGLDPAMRDRIVSRVAESAGWYVEALRHWHPGYRPVVEGIDRAIGLAAQRAALTAFLIFLIGVVQAVRLPPGRLGPATRDSDGKGQVVASA